MDIPTNLKTDLIDSLFSMTDNLQYNQEDVSNSFGAIFQDQLGSGAKNQENSRQNISGNRQENSFESRRASQKNNTENTSSNKNQNIKTENESSNSKNLVASEDGAQNIEISMLDQDEVVLENIEVILDNKVEENSEFVLAVLEDKVVIEEIKEDLVKDELIVEVVDNEKNTIIALAEMNQDNAKVIFFENNITKENILDNDSESYLIEEKDSDNYDILKTVANNVNNKEKDVSSKIELTAEVDEQEKLAFLEIDQDIEALQKDKDLKSLTNNIGLDLDKNTTNEIEFDENGFDLSNEVKESRNIEQSIDTKEIKNNGDSKFEEIMARLEQVKQDPLAKAAEIKELADKSEIKLASNQIDNKISSSYKQSSQKLINYQKSQLEADNTSNFKIKSDYIENSIFDGKWGKYFGDKLLSLSVQGAKQAIIHIEPPELGPVDVRIDMDKDKTSISFSSHHAQVRQILEDSTLKLKEIFLEQGLSNLEVNVSDKENSGSFFEERNSKSNNSVLAENEEENIPVQDNRSNGLIDYFV
jgi:flagellar hook-length control protein FliK